MQQRNGLRQIDDVNIVAHTEDVLTHARVPTVLLVTEVNASFQQLTHSESGNAMAVQLLIFRFRPPQGVAALARLHRMDSVQERKPTLRVECARYSRR
jgi:hypothetical protein